jgi:uncharacterized protein YqjF (DUF2071 family)
VVAFRLSDIHLNGLPPVPGVRAFPEVNLRTYVRCGDRRGVLFLSLHCPNLMAIALGSAWFRLPYRYAPARIAESEGDVSFTCPRFSAMYRPTSVAGLSEAASLEAWLTERYSYFARSWRGRLVRCDVDHAPWRLATAEAIVRTNQLVAPSSARPPLLHYAQHMVARIYPLRAVAETRHI